MADSISFWLLREPRDIQSFSRSSSSMAPRMRCVAKVSNCTPCARLIAGQRIGQADQADLDQVVHLHAGRQLGHHVVRQAAHQGLVLLDQCVAVELALGGVHQWLLAARPNDTPAEGTRSTMRSCKGNRMFQQAHGQASQFHLGLGSLWLRSIAMGLHVVIQKIAGALGQAGSRTGCIRMGGATVGLHHMQQGGLQRAVAQKPLERDVAG